jgi:hypothetical protein
VVRDALCGGTGGNFNSDAPLSPDLVEKNGKSPPSYLVYYFEKKADS